MPCNAERVTKISVLFQQWFQGGRRFGTLWPKLVTPSISALRSLSLFSHFDSITIVCLFALSICMLIIHICC